MLYEFNPWWEYEDVPKDMLPPTKRDLFEELVNKLSLRRIEVIVGLRRVGKTTLMYQLIHHLIESGISPLNILYFSFDLENVNIVEMLKEYEEKVLKNKIRDSSVYLFFDEIHKLTGWENKIKVLYDLYPKVKIFLSGSASLNIMRGSSESLAGRAKYHYLPPLKFREYLRFKNIEVKNFEIQAKTLRIALWDFIKRGFPETVRMEDKEIEEYVKDLILTRIIYRDIPEVFSIRDVGIVWNLAEYILKNPGVIVNVDSLASQFRRSRRTIMNSLSYLQMTYIIKLIANFRGSYLSGSRKNKKAYGIHPTLSKTSNEDLLLESLVRSEMDAEYYWRDGNKEVDFVIANSGITGIEVKNKENVTKRDADALKIFMKKFGAKDGYIVYMGEDEYEMEGIKIMPVPNFILKWEKNEF